MVSSTGVTFRNCLFPFDCPKCEPSSGYFLATIQLVEKTTKKLSFSFYNRDLGEEAPLTEYEVIKPIIQVDNSSSILHPTAPKFKQLFFDTLYNTQSNSIAYVIVDIEALKGKDAVKITVKPLDNLLKIKRLVSSWSKSPYFLRQKKTVQDRHISVNLSRDREIPTQLAPSQQVASVPQLSAERFAEAADLSVLTIPLLFHKYKVISTYELKEKLADLKQTSTKAHDHLRSLFPEIRAAHAICLDRAASVHTSNLPKIFDLDDKETAYSPDPLINFFTNIQKDLESSNKEKTNREARQKVIVYFDHVGLLKKLKQTQLGKFATIDCSQYAIKHNTHALGNCLGSELVELFKLEQKLHHAKSVKILATTSWSRATASRGEDLTSCLTMIYSLFKKFLSPETIAQKFSLVCTFPSEDLDEEAQCKQKLCNQLMILSQNAQQPEQKEALNFFQLYADKVITKWSSELDVSAWEKETDTLCTEKIGNPPVTNRLIQKKVNDLATEYADRKQTYNAINSEFQKLDSDWPNIQACIRTLSSV